MSTSHALWSALTSVLPESENLQFPSGIYSNLYGWRIEDIHPYTFKYTTEGNCEFSLSNKTGVKAGGEQPESKGGGLHEHLFIILLILCTEVEEIQYMDLFSLLLAYMCVFLYIWDNCTDQFGD